MPQLLVFDANYVGYVSAFSLSQGLSYRGSQTEIIFGFLRQVIALSNKFLPTQIAFCWDSRFNKRKEMLPEYKANRKKEMTAEEKESLAIVYSQFDEIRNIILPALGFNNVFLVDGYESDDLIANLVSGRNPDETIIITSDNDLLQLLDNCSLYSITKKQSTSKEIFQREYGIEPKDWAMVKAIAGCSSDNVPGVKGVGEKTAVDFLHGRAKGKRLKDIQESSQIIDRNIPLVKLPLVGCPRPMLRKNSLSIAKFHEVGNFYGMSSLVSQKILSEWSSIIALID